MGFDIKSSKFVRKKPRDGKNELSVKSGFFLVLLPVLGSIYPMCLIVPYVLWQVRRPIVY